MDHKFYSQRKGTNPNLQGLPLPEIKALFVRVYEQLRADGYFHEAFGFYCVDAGDVPGRVADVDLEILLTVRKRMLWPIEHYSQAYSEDDFFDVLEFLFQHVSKPIDGHYHSYNDCGMHWETFNKSQGQTEFRDRINGVLGHYVSRFEMSEKGEILEKADEGFEQIFDADIPISDDNVSGRMKSAILRFRRHGSTIEERKNAVRDLADVLEYLRPQVKALLTSADENDLFNIANNFAIRHHNDKQKTGYDTSIWLSWMFYFYLATLHVVIRKIEKGAN